MQLFELLMLDNVMSFEKRDFEGGVRGFEFSKNEENHEKPK
jgi:hypothetical protein